MKLKREGKGRPAYRDRAAQDDSVSSQSHRRERGNETREAEIRELAYRLYEQRGRVDGYFTQDWLEAEASFLQQGKLVA